MALVNNILRMQKKTSEEIINDLPKFNTTFGSESNMVCTINRLKNSTFKISSKTEINYNIKSLMIFILDQCIDQIHILCGGRTRNSELSLFSEILENKSINMHEPVYDKVTGEPYQVVFNRMQNDKHYNDSAILKEFITLARNEFKEFGSFELFRNLMRDIKAKINDAYILLKESSINKNKMTKLKYSLMNLGRDCRLKIHEMNDMNMTSSDSFQNIVLKDIILLRYVKAYETSRFEQNKIKCDREIRELQNIISKYRHKIELENRVHEEILYYINENQKDIIKDTNIWINKYNGDIELNNFQLIQLKERLENIKNFKEQIIIRFAEHKKSVEDFKDYKEKKRIENEKKQKLLEAATKIQAWWRGTRYRRQLGPYNPNKTKKDKKKKNKK